MDLHPYDTEHHDTTHRNIITLHVELTKCITRNNASMAPTPNEKLPRCCTRRDGHGSIAHMSKILRVL
jgi:hypothetical protein